jgi:hypothetical protein
MQKLQLYISDTRVDLFKDETVSMTQSIQNVKDLAKVFTEFTQTFSLPASKTNNKLFKHYYNFDISGGFDARNKVSSRIELNFIPFKKGYLKLEGVDMQKNKPYAYRVTFFGETVNLKDLLGEDELSSLVSLNSYNLTYSESFVFNYLRTYQGSGEVIAPLITHSKRLYYNSGSSNQGDGNLNYQGGQQHGVLWSDLKYAIRLSEIVDAIESKYGVTFSSDFFSSSNDNFYNLYMWMHRKKGSVVPTEQINISYKQVPAFTGSGNQTTTTEGAINIASTDILYGALTKNDLTLNPTTGTSDYYVRIFKDGSLYYQSQKLTGTNTIGQSEMGALGVGAYTVSIGVESSSVTFNPNGVKWEIDGYTSSGTFSDEWNNPITFTASTDLEFVITENLPEMKIIDFLTALFKMFNLTSYVNDAGTIVVQPLDDFYADSDAETFEIDEYVDINSSQVDVALPFKKINFQFEGNETFIAQQFKQLNNREWGQLKYTLDDDTFDAPENEYNVNVPFEHMQFERLVDQDTGNNTDVQYGYFVDDNQDAYIGLPLIFYSHRITSGTAISFRNSESTHTSLSDYIIPSNSIEINSSTNDDTIHFGLETNEYTLDNTFDGSLFENYYKSYIEDIFNSKRRIIKVKAWLPLKILHNLKLYDTFTLNNQSYRINSITSNLTTGESDIELLNIV